MKLLSNEKIELNLEINSINNLKKGEFFSDPKVFNESCKYIPLDYILNITKYQSLVVKYSSIVKGFVIDGNCANGIREHMLKNSKSKEDFIKLLIEIFVLIKHNYKKELPVGDYNNYHYNFTTVNIITRFLNHLNYSYGSGLIINPSQKRFVLKNHSISKIITNNTLIEPDLFSTNFSSSLKNTFIEKKILLTVAIDEEYIPIITMLGIHFPTVNPIKYDRTKFKILIDSSLEQNIKESTSLKKLFKLYKSFAKELGIEIIVFDNLEEYLFQSKMHSFNSFSERTTLNNITKLKEAMLL
jgi:hypothetical protein